jgi:hypothetical protein
VLRRQRVRTLSLAESDALIKIKSQYHEVTSNFNRSFVILIISCRKDQPKYSADWESLSQVNPVPEWFKDAKFGIYFHWGVYSVPAYSNEWYPRNMYREGSRENLHHIENYGKPDEWPYHFFITGADDKQGNFMQFAPRIKVRGR